MITSTQAAQYLDQALGVSLPSFIVDAAISKVEAAESAMAAAGYGEADQVLIQCMAVALVAAAGSPRRIQSQGSASGASRSFKIADGDLSSLRRSLLAIDPMGVVADIVGPDPSHGSLMMVV